MARGIPEALTPPAGNPRFPLLDGLRAVAALSVVVYHANQYARGQEAPLGQFADHLDAGVAVFFVITGFLIYRPFLAASRDVGRALGLREFYWRRFLRIAPGYWVALLAMAPLLTFAAPAGLPNAALVQVYRPEAWARSGIAPAWSVCVEVSFYALVPLFAALVHARRRPSDGRILGVLAALALGCMLFRDHVRDENLYFTWFNLLPTTLLWFTLGMALAVVSTSSSGWAARVRERVGAAVLPCFAIAAVVFVLCGLGDDHSGTQSDTLFLAYGAIAVLLVAPAVFAGPRRGRLLGHPAVAWLGLVSYGIYLYHYPLIGEFAQHVHVQRSTYNLALYGGFGVVASVACGALSYYVVERNALRLKHTQS